MLRNDTLFRDGTTHPAASTLVECQKACEFDPRCVAVDWSSRNETHESRCLINTNPSHDHRPSVNNDLWKHYDLVSRCSITPGQCFDSNVVASMNILTEKPCYRREDRAMRL